MACVSLQLIGFVIFLKGFFPPKVVLDGFSKFDEHGSPFTVNGRPQFDKIIVMVVDAMRSDFMFSEENSEMKFLHSLIEGGNAIPLTAYSHPPTVTLPRLKGITTGGAPSFVDAILNVADDKDDSQGLSSTDSWVLQFKNKGQGKVLHFYGDDTWLKLFPPADFFEKFEGTNSFFVSDFTEVDSNVTRHLDSELNDTQWDGLILHYLGLDHIGHKGGPNSVFMKPKQQEMDEVLRRIYESCLVKNEDTLMVLLGDHGMNELGNHGGSSPGETHPGLTFISPKFSKLHSERAFPFLDSGNFEYFSLVAQIDLVPSLAALLDFPIPKNNLGIIIPELLELWDEQDRKAILFENSKQLMGLLQSKFSKDSKELRAFELALSILGRADQIDIEEYFSFLREAQEVLAESATNYSYSDIGLGATLILCSVILFLGQLAYQLKGASRNSTIANLAFTAISFLYSLHFHGSSLIEEEHQLWWFFTIIYFSVLFMSTRPTCVSRFMCCLLGIRLLRAWNNSGQKFHTSLTISNFILSMPNLLWLLNILTYITVTCSLVSGKGWQESFVFTSTPPSPGKVNIASRTIAAGLASFLGCSSLVFKIFQYLNDGKDIPDWLMNLLSNPYFNLKIDIDDKKEMQSLNVELSKVFFFTFVGLVILRILVGKARKLHATLITDLFNLSCFLLMHQSRTEVIPIFLIFGVVRRSYRLILRDATVSTSTKVMMVTCFVLCMQNLSFFSVGNTNLLATVDLSNAYNGIGEYDIFLVALMTFVSNYSVVIFWSLSGIELLHDSIQLLNLPEYRREARKVILARSKLTALFYGFSMMNLVGSCINLRFHLFIWSVFSPKLLYFASWVLLVNLGIDLLLSTALLA